MIVIVIIFLPHMSNVSLYSSFIIYLLYLCLYLNFMFTNKHHHWLISPLLFYLIDFLIFANFLMLTLIYIYLTKFFKHRIYPIKSVPSLIVKSYVSCRKIETKTRAKYTKLIGAAKKASYRYFKHRPPGGADQANVFSLFR